MPTFIHGIAASENIDSSGERILIGGLDISSLERDGVFTWEHENKTPDCVVGKILKARKIFSEKDCEDDNQLYFWNKCEVPYVYAMGELFDDYKDSAKEVAGLFRYDEDKKTQNLVSVMNFSIEGAKIQKVGIDIVKSIARKITCTVMPCNKAAVAEVVPSADSKESDPLDSIFKSEPNFRAELLKSENHSKSTSLKKEGISPTGAPMGPSSLLSSEKMAKSSPLWSGPEVNKDKTAMHFHHPEHGVVSVLKHPDGEFHVKHNGALAGLKGNKGVFSSAAAAGEHAKNYMNAVSGKTTSAPQLHNRPSPSIGKSDGMKKSLSAGSGLGAPGSLVQGAALAKESLDKRMKKANAIHKSNSGNPTDTGSNLKSPSKQMSGSSIAGGGNRHSDSMSAQGVSAGIGTSRGRRWGGSMMMSEKGKWLARAEEAYSKWEKKEDFERYMAKRMPNLTKGEVAAIGQTLALHKHMKAERAMAKIAKAAFGAEQEGSYIQKNKKDKVSSVPAQMPIAMLTMSEKMKKFDDGVMDAPMSMKEKNKSSLKKDSDILMASEKKSRHSRK